MVPVLVVGIFWTLGTNGVLAAAAFHGDVCAWNGSRALQCQGSPDPPLPLQLCSLQDPVLWRATHEGWLAGFPGRWCLSSLRGSSGVGQSPLPLTSHPQLPWALPLTWGAAGAADLMLGFVVLLFPVPARSVLRVVWMLLHGEMEVGGRITQGSAGKGTGTRERAVQTPFCPPKPATTHLHGPLPHQSGLGCCQETAEAQDERPPGQAAGGGGPWQAHGGQ